MESVPVGAYAVRPMTRPLADRVDDVYLSPMSAATIPVYTMSGTPWEYRGMTPGGMVRLWAIGGGASLTERPDRVFVRPPFAAGQLVLVPAARPDVKSAHLRAIAATRGRVVEDRGERVLVSLQRVSTYGSVKATTHEFARADVHPVFP